jgi:hypothetical protein
MDNSANLTASSGPINSNMYDSDFSTSPLTSSAPL